MSASTAIGMVGESLKEMLEAEMQLTPAVNVSLLAPDESGSSRRINLFLYKVAENTFMKNKEWEVTPGNAGRIRPPPLSLNLFYLMTPYAQNDPENGNITAHEIMGEAMRVFHENPIVPEAHLVDGLQGAREQIKIMLSQVDLDELSKIWSTFSEPFRLSVMYEVSVVQLDQSPARERDMATRINSIGVPTVAAPFALPNVRDMQPINGPVGTVVTFAGEHLQGWKAYTSISGTPVLNAADIAGNSFSMTIPPSLQPGFHQVRVDISRLVRKTFFFEVTP